MVATEVRKLAKDSASSANEIKTLIQDSIEKVNAGSELVNRSGETLREIVESVEQVSATVAQISQSATEQGEEIEQVGMAINRLDDIMRQNTAVTESASISSRSVVSQAENVKRLLTFFGTHPATHATSEDLENLQASGGLH